MLIFAAELRLDRNIFEIFVSFYLFLEMYCTQTRSIFLRRFDLYFKLSKKLCQLTSSAHHWTTGHNDTIFWIFSCFPLSEFENHHYYWEWRIICYLRSYLSSCPLVFPDCHRLSGDNFPAFCPNDFQFGTGVLGGTPYSFVFNVNICTSWRILTKFCTVDAWSLLRRIVWF